MIGLDLGFTNPVRTWGVVNVFLCLSCSGVDGVGGVGENWVGAWNRVRKGGMVFCLCEL